MTQEDYALNVCLNREGFQAILHILTYKDQQMMVFVEGRQPLCWSCKLLGHLARFCQQKNPLTNNNNNDSNTKDKSTSLIAKPALEPGDHQSGSEEGWTQVTGKKKQPSRTTASEAAPATGTESTRNETATGTATVETTTKTAESAETIATESPPPLPKKAKRKGEKNTEGEQPEEMETTVNLKRRKYSGVNQAKKTVYTAYPTPKKKKFTPIHLQKSHHRSLQKSLHLIKRHLNNPQLEKIHTKTSPTIPPSSAKPTAKIPPTIPSSWSSLLSISSLSFTPRLFSRSRSMNRLSLDQKLSQEYSQDPKARYRAKSVSEETEELPADS